MKLRRTVVVLVLVLASVPAFGLDLFDIPPDSSRSEVEGLLDEAGLRYRSLRSSRLEVRASLLADVFELQRAVFEFGMDERLHTVTVEITPAFDSDGLEVLELYEEVASMLLRRLGSPTRERSTGAIRDADQILLGLSTGEVVRLMEWDGDSNIRVGIPRRADGNVFVVVAISSREFPHNDQFWGPDHP